MPPRETAVVCEPTALPRSVGGNAATRMAVPTDWPNELPMAMTIRATISTWKVGATAVARPPMPKMARPTRWMRRRPTTSAKRPNGSRVAAMINDSTMTTQPTDLRLTSKLDAMSGRATNTIDMAITEVKNDSPTARKTRHL